MSGASTVAVEAADGHRWELMGHVPAQPRAVLLWLPALGTGARHYQPFAQALSARGVATYVHEWRGAGSSSLRAGRDSDWGYRELLEHDIPASAAALQRLHPGLPALIGGHSLGGQLACCRLALAPGSAQRLWLVATGAPYWRAFPRPLRLLLPLVYRFLPWLSDRLGAMPGRALRFGGREARGLIRDWTRTGLTGTYAARDVDADLEAGLAALRTPVHALVIADDWLGPAPSMHLLLSKLAAAPVRLDTIDEAQLGARADHFTWMKHPAAIAERLAASVDQASG